MEVALTQGLAARIQPLLDTPTAGSDVALPDTAIFYSISNCQRGLTGVSFGNLLIKQVVDALSAEFPSIRTFATLSPIPGFRSWLRRTLRDGPPKFLTDNHLEILNQKGWAETDVKRRRVKNTLMRLCAHYLTQISDDGYANDPVARFHLGNGASIKQINWAGDLSEKGLCQSVGLMVNYHYVPDEIVANHEAYIGKGQIAVSGKVRSLLK